MNHATRTRIPALIVSLLAAVFALTSCKLKVADDGEAPTLPPVSSLVMSFGDFPSDPVVTRDVAMSVIVATTSNYNYAATNVAVWDTVLKVGLAIPVASFVAAINQTPTKQSDGSWLWGYSFSVLGVPYTAKLYGKVVNATVEWDMYISQAGGFTNFHWYEGVSNIDGTQGSWTLMKDPDNAHAFLSIEWSRNKTAGTGDIQYTNVETGTTGEGDYIHYGTTTDVTYNAYYDIFDASAADLIAIEWNRTTTAGRVKNLAHFGNEDWHYWDELHQDIDAPVL